eukprot:708096-Alexandrium_andersonii.AAC.1
MKAWMSKGTDVHRCEGATVWSLVGYMYEPWASMHRSHKRARDRTRMHKRTRKHRHACSRCDATHLAQQVQGPRHGATNACRA